MQKLYIIRGLPGSGKSTHAQKIVSTDPSHIKHFEADMFFTDGVGEYKFIPEKINIAHQWCQNMANYALRDGYSVVVSNTFSQLWEMRPYIDMAEYYQVPVEVMTMLGNYGNIHDVPGTTIDRMRNRWED
jgi:predicted kinase